MGEGKAFMPMPTKLQQLLRAAKKLPDGERTELALRILDTIEAPDQLKHLGDKHLDDKAWVAEIERRAESAMSGRTRGVPWSTVRAKLERRVKPRKRR